MTEPKLCWCGRIGCFKQHTSITEPTPRTNASEWETHDGIMVVTSDRVRIIERSLARKEALLRRWVERKKAEGGLLQDGLLEDTERELKGE